MVVDHPKADRFAIAVADDLDSGFIVITDLYIGMNSKLPARDRGIAVIGHGIQQLNIRAAVDNRGGRGHIGAVQPLCFHFVLVPAVIGGFDPIAVIKCHYIRIGAVVKASESHPAVVVGRIAIATFIISHL